MAGVCYNGRKLELGFKCVNKQSLGRRGLGNVRKAQGQSQTLMQSEPFVVRPSSPRDEGTCTGTF